MAVSVLSDFEFKGSVDLQGPLLLEGAAGTAGQVLKSNGAGQPPEWGDDGGGGGSVGIDPVIAGMIF